MTRARNGLVNKKRHKKVLKLAKGYRGRAKSCFRTAIERVEKGLQYAYRDRKNRKRDMRGLWIVRINAAVREYAQYDLTYSRFMSALKALGIELDRKALAELAVNEKEMFRALVEKAAAVA
ncbi:MAG: 50S ribosomal protein L20 [Rickettsiales bacterium]